MRRMHGAQMMVAERVNEGSVGLLMSSGKCRIFEVFRSGADDVGQQSEAADCTST